MLTWKGSILSTPRKLQIRSHTKPYSIGYDVAHGSFYLSFRSHIPNAFLLT